MTSQTAVTGLCVIQKSIKWSVLGCLTLHCTSWTHTVPS